MERKTAFFGVGNRQGEVAYVIFEEIVYFTQTSGIQSSINAAEEIVESISKQEGIDWKDYKWVDIQRAGRYSENAEDQLIFSGGLNVSGWKPIKVPKEVFEVLMS